MDVHRCNPQKILRRNQLAPNDICGLRRLYCGRTEKRRTISSADQDGNLRADRAPLGPLPWNTAVAFLALMGCANRPACGSSRAGWDCFFDTANPILHRLAGPCSSSSQKTTQKAASFWLFLLEAGRVCLIRRRLPICLSCVALLICLFHPVPRYRVQLITDGVGRGGRRPSS